MTVETSEQVALQMLQDKATRLRIDSVRSTTEAGSGHPTSCASAAEIMSVLFYSVMRYDPRDPHRRESDVFVLSKGHAAPILYAAWAEAGAFPREKLLTRDRLRQGITIGGSAEEGITIELRVVVEYGLNLAEVASTLRNRVQYEVERLTGLPIAEVDVRIQDVKRSTA